MRYDGTPTEDRDLVVDVEDEGEEFAIASRALFLISLFSMQSLCDSPALVMRAFNCFTLIASTSFEDESMLTAALWCLGVDEEEDDEEEEDKPIALRLVFFFLLFRIKRGTSSVPDGVLLGVSSITLMFWYKEEKINFKKKLIGHKKHITSSSASGQPIR